MKTWLIDLTLLEGLFAIAQLFREPSESGNSVFLGLSVLRIGMATATILFWLLLLWFRIRQVNKPFLRIVFHFIGVFSGMTLLFSRFPQDDTSNLIYLFGSRAQPLLIWLFLSAVQCGLALQQGQEAIQWMPTAFVGTAAVSYAVLGSYMDRHNWMVALKGHWWICALPFVFALFWVLIRAKKGTKHDTLAGMLFFAILSFCVIRGTECWIGRVNTPSKAYWHLLAESMLNGKLSLPDPVETHDLTFFNGSWYVPNPPLPAIILIPVVWLLGSADAVNMSVFSAVLGGINAGLVFLLLRRASERGLFRITLNGSIWLTIAFIFGSDHFWLATTGQMWFISQLLTVTFTVLAVLSVIEKKSPWLAGAMLGLGVLSRPNICTVYLCMVGIYLWQETDFPQIDWKRAIGWCLRSGIPVCIAVFFLLFYNKVRFDDWMDFGYVTINGADWILDSVTQYGMFHPHFLKINTDVMLFGVPRLDFSGKRFFFDPYVSGYSIFLMSPTLFYTFRNLKKNRWVIGCWASVLVTLGLLLMYHNTGAEQVGYRYILDAAAPLLLLVGNGIKEKPSWVFKAMSVFSILLAFLSIYWWYIGRS